MTGGEVMNQLLNLLEGCIGMGHSLLLVCIVHLLFFLSVTVRAQDALPSCVRVQPVLEACDSLPCWSQFADTVFVPEIMLPQTFRHTVCNELTDSIGILNPFWEKLRLVHAGVAGDSLNIVHVGDSHIRGHIFPQTAGAGMKQVFGSLRYIDFGINGAFCFSFIRPERMAHIVALKPDLLILSLGTNESHNRRYNSQVHYRQLDELIRMLRKDLPDVPILLTTPPGSYESFRQHRRPRVYKVNSRTMQTVNTIRRYADANGLAVWDMYEVFGGVQRAALNWWESGLMRPDHVHYLPAGYELQGRMFLQALLKAYNRYISE